VEVYHALRHHTKRDTTPKPAWVARVTPAQLPANVDKFTGRAQELADLDHLLATSRCRALVTASRVRSAALVLKRDVEWVEGAKETLVATG